MSTMFLGINLCNSIKKITNRKNLSNSAVTMFHILLCIWNLR